MEKRNRIHIDLREHSSIDRKIVLETDPRISVSGGAHPTTSLCIHLIERYLKPGNRFLDVGTGTGILMIVAAGLGAGYVTGIDHNPIAVETARKNLLLNEIEEHRFEVRIGNRLDGMPGQYDLIAVNIVPYIINRMLEDVPKVLEQEGVIICSGILQGNAHGITSKMRAEGFEILETQTKDMWVAIAARLKT